MSAQARGSVLGGLAGAGIGALIGGPTGAMYGYSLGSSIGSYYSAPDGPDLQGPRLQDRTISTSSYGAGLTRVWGRERVAGNIIWLQNNEIEEVAKTEELDGGAKGGGPDPGTQTTYTYFATLAVAVAAGSNQAIPRIWADNTLIYDASENATGEAMTAAAQYSDSITIYNGTEDQLPDPIIEAEKGVGNTPAFRGTAYFVIERLKLENWGNRIPNITAEVIGTGITAPALLDAFGNSKGTLSFSGRDSDYPDGDTGLASNPLGDGSYLMLATDSDWTTSTNYYGDAYQVRVYPDKSAKVVTQWRQNLSPPFFSRDVRRLGYGYYTLDSIDTYGHRGFSGSASGGELFTAVQIGKIGNEGVSAEKWINLRGVNASRYIVDYNPLTKPDDEAKLYWSGQSDFETAPTATQARQIRYQEIKESVTPLDKLGDGVARTPGHGTLAATADDADYSWDVNLNTVWIFNHTAKSLQAVGDFTISQTLTIPNELTGWTDAEIRNINNKLCRLMLYKYSGGVGTISMYDISLEDYTVTEVGDVPAGNGISNDMYPPRHLFFNDAYLIGFGGSAINTHAEPLTTQRWNLYNTPYQTISLGDVIEDVATEAGLDSSDLDVTGVTAPVYGYHRSEPATARSIVDQLIVGYTLNAAQSGYKLKYKDRDATSVATIPESDLRAHHDGSETPALITETIVKEQDLPRRVSMTYSDHERLYERGTQSWSRQIGIAKNEQNYEIPASMTAQQSLDSVFTILLDAWASRRKYSFSLPLKYIRLEPEDVVTITLSDKTILCRIESVELVGYLLNFTAVSVGTPAYTPPQVAEDPVPITDELRTTGITNAIFIDAPPLRSVDDNSGFYLAAEGGENWRGAIIYESSDGGQSWHQAAIVDEVATMGHCETTLGNADQHIVDVTNSLTVSFNYGQTLSGSTQAEFEADKNISLVGYPGAWEVINYKDVTDNGDGSFTISHLKRGLRDTDDKISTHEAGELFVKASLISWTRTTADDNNIGVEKLYKVVTAPVSANFAYAPEERFTNNANAVRPFSPDHLTAHRETSGDVVLNWIPGARYVFEMRDGVGIGETETGNFEIDILDSGSSVVATKTVTGAETYTYTAADQTTDLGGSGTDQEFTANVYAMNATSGRGRATSIDVPVEGYELTAPATWNRERSSSMILSESNYRFDSLAAANSWGYLGHIYNKASGAKLYLEFEIVAIGGWGQVTIGVSSNPTPYSIAAYAKSWAYTAGNGNLYNENISTTASGVTATTGDTLSIALDLENKKLWIAKNNVWIGGGNPATGAFPTFPRLHGDMYWIGGQTGNNSQLRSVQTGSHSYTAPSGFTAI